MKGKYKAVLAIAAFLMLYAWASTQEWTEQVICNMPEKAYTEIKDTLGEDASDHDIARYYQKNYR